ncbi:MAG: NifU family protein [Mangrovimonas sp.]|nr:NifU family protein [Mangrovimonas sp.]
MHTISIKSTNNPSIVKFESNQFLVKNQSYEFNNIDEAKSSTIAQQLFYLPFVKKVYISGNFIAIEKFNIVEWNDIADEVASQIETYLNSGESIVTAEETKKVPVTVYAESTPNPTVMKFVANKKISLNPFEFLNIEEAKISPLATKLFHLPFVKSIFIDENFISVSKYDVVDWNEVTMEVREMIRSFIENGNDVISSEIVQEKKASPEISSEINSETSKQIVSILDEYVKPAVAGDGGNIIFKSYDEKSKTVELILQGACSGCPSSTITLKSGIETMLREMLHGKVESVVAYNG